MGSGCPVWQWWTSARDPVAAAIEDGSAGALVDEISDRVKAIDKARVLTR